MMRPAGIRTGARTRSLERSVTLISAQHIFLGGARIAGMRTRNGDELRALAADFTGSLRPRKGATVVALSGKLGAGKTAFVQGIGRALGIEEAISSPTFVIIKIYDLPMSDLRSRSFRRLVHIDAFRLKGEHHLEVLGWNEYVSDPSNLICIEWPEVVPGVIPRDAIRVKIDIDGDGRRITIDGEENRSGQ